MPFVHFVTNLPADRLGPTFNQIFNQVLADAIPEKPYELFAINTVANATLTFGGSSEPAAVVHIKAYGIYTPEKNVEYSKAICTFLADVGIPGERVLIDFSDLPASHCGFNFTTAQKLIDEGKI
uniref:Macrophage migration inhibitory factor n=1 Tax=Panagrellus redivivus TaxID=6233 RepID=A0A7E4V2C6_PANRE